MDDNIHNLRISARKEVDDLCDVIESQRSAIDAKDAKIQQFVGEIERLTEQKNNACLERDRLKATLTDGQSVVPVALYHEAQRRLRELEKQVGAVESEFKQYRESRGHNDKLDIANDQLQKEIERLKAARLVDQECRRGIIDNENRMAIEKGYCQKRIKELEDYSHELAAEVDRLKEQQKRDAAEMHTRRQLTGRIPKIGVPLAAADDSVKRVVFTLNEDMTPASELTSAPAPRADAMHAPVSSIYRLRADHSIKVEVTSSPYVINTTFKYDGCKTTMEGAIFGFLFEPDEATAYATIDELVDQWIEAHPQWHGERPAATGFADWLRANGHLKE
jgi:hypothetical protein